MNESQVIDELWNNVGEYLEMVPQKRWPNYLVPVLIRQLTETKNQIEYLKKRLENEYHTKHSGMACPTQEQDRS